MTEEKGQLVEINGTRLYHEYHDAAESNVTVAFLNGILMTVESWMSQIDYFPKRYRCLFHDTRGQLKSDKPDEPYSMALHAEDFKCLLDHFGIEKCHVVGTSYGGEIGMVFASMFPERIAGLTLISCFSQVDDLLNTHIQSWIDVARACPENLFDVATSCVFSAGFRNKYKMLLQARKQWFGNRDAAYYNGFIRLAETVRQVDIKEKLNDIQCPTLVVCGEKDTMTPVEYSRQVADEINGSEFVIIPDAPHGVVLERPNEINTVVNGFIEKNRFSSNEENHGNDM